MVFDRQANCVTSGPFLLEKEEDRVLLIKAVLHASDISNPVRPFHVNCVMSTSVHREFRYSSESAVSCSCATCCHSLQSGQAVIASTE